MEKRARVASGSVPQMDLSGARILVVDDDPGVQLLLSRLLNDEDYTVDCVASGSEALGLIEEKEYNLFIVDKNLPDISGVDLIVRTRSLQPESEVIVVTAYASYESAVATLRLGVFDYLEKPFSDMAIVAEKVRRALEKQRLFADNKVLADGLRSMKREMEDMKRMTTPPEPGEGGGDMDRINRYVAEMVDRLTMEAREERERLQQDLRQILRQAAGVREMMDGLAEERVDPAAALEQIERLLRMIDKLASTSDG